MPAAASFICRAAGHRCCAATLAIVIAGRQALLARLAAVAPKLEGTAFSYRERNDHVEAICPWGNRLRCFEPDAGRFGRIALGMPYVEFDVPRGTAEAISRFYPEIMGIPASVVNGDGVVARARSARTSICNSARPISRRASSTAITSRSTSRTSRAPTSGCASAIWSRARTISTSTASATSSIPPMAASVHRRARGAQRHPPDVSAAAGQPQSGRRPTAPSPTATIRRLGRWGRTSMTVERPHLRITPSSANSSHETTCFLPAPSVRDPTRGLLPEFGVLQPAAAEDAGGWPRGGRTQGPALDASIPDSPAASMSAPAPRRLA